MLTYPQVALDFMNHDHAEFAKTREALLQLLTEGAVPEAVDSLLDKLVSHTQQHFADEEQAMQAGHFPPYPMHKMEHDRLLAEVSRRVNDWKQGRDARVLRSFLEFALAEWFVNHVGMMDFVTARFIANQNLTTP
jgi:hemerythrin